MTPEQDPPKGEQDPAEEAATQPLRAQPIVEGAHTSSSTPPEVRAARQGVDPDATADPIPGTRDSIFVPTLSPDAASADAPVSPASPSGADLDADIVRRMVDKDQRPYAPVPDVEGDVTIQDTFAVDERDPSVIPTHELPAAPFQGERPTADSLGIEDELSTDTSGAQPLPSEARQRGAFKKLTSLEPTSADPFSTDPSAPADAEAPTAVFAGQPVQAADLAFRDLRPVDHDAEADTELHEVEGPTDLTAIGRNRAADALREFGDKEETERTARVEETPTELTYAPTDEIPPVHPTAEVGVSSVGISPEEAARTTDVTRSFLGQRADSEEWEIEAPPVHDTLTGEALLAVKETVGGARGGLEAVGATTKAKADALVRSNPALQREAARFGGARGLFRRLSVPLLALGAALFLLKDGRAPQAPDQTPEPAPMADTELPETPPRSIEPLARRAQAPNPFDINGDGVNELPEPTGLRPGFPTGSEKVGSAPEPVEPPLSSAQQAWQEIQDNSALKAAAQVKPGDGFWKIATRLHQVAPNKFPAPAEWMGKIIRYTGPDGQQYQTRASEAFISQKDGYVFLDANGDIHMADAEGVILDPINHPHDVYFTTIGPAGSLGDALTPGGAGGQLGPRPGTRPDIRPDTLPGESAPTVADMADDMAPDALPHALPHALPDDAESSQEPNQDEIQTAPLDTVAASDLWTSNPTGMVDYLRDKIAIRLPSGLVDSNISDIIERNGLSFSLYRKPNGEYDPNDVRVYPQGRQQPGFPIAGIKLTPEVAQKIGEQVKASADGKVDYGELLQAIGYSSDDGIETVER